MHGTVLGQGRLKGFANKRTGSTKKSRVIAIVSSSNYFNEEDMEIQD